MNKKHTTSPCIEWIFADRGDLADRVRAAKAAGYSAVEFHLWRDKPMDRIAEALTETGTKITSFCVDPRRSMVDTKEHAEFLQAIADSIEIGKTVGSPPMIVASGFRVPGLSNADHHKNAVVALRKAAALVEAAGVMLLLEPLNDRVELPLIYLSSTTEALDIIEAVNSPNVRLLYDIYHSATMGEQMLEVLRGRMHLVQHVQAADTFGRHEPGTGGLAWPQIMSALAELGYEGDMGLEYFPTQPSEASLETACKVMGL